MNTLAPLVMMIVGALGLVLASIFESVPKRDHGDELPDLAEARKKFHGPSSPFYTERNERWPSTSRKVKTSRRPM